MFYSDQGSQYVSWMQSAIVALPHETELETEE